MPTPAALAPLASEARVPGATAGAQWGNFCRRSVGPLASPRTKVPATPLGLGAAPRGSARGPYLSWNGRRGLCSAALAGKGLQAGCAWPGPRGSLHSLADDRRPLLAPAGSAFYAGAPEAGACTGQAGCPDTTAGPQSPRAPEPPARGLSPGAAAPSTAGESLIKASGGAGPEGAGRPAGPAPRVRAHPGRTPRVPRLRRCGPAGPDPTSGL